MRVVHVINRLMGGGAEVMVPQIHQLHRSSGLDSLILSMETGDDRGTEGVVAFGRRHRRVAEPWLLLRHLRRIERESGRIDILHTHLTQSQAFARLVRRFLRYPPRLVTTEHDTSNRRRTLPGGRAFDRWLYRRYDRIICISDAVRDSLLEWLPRLDPERLVVIPNGIPVERFAAAVDGRTREPGRLRCLSVGRLTAKKNFALALHALAACADLCWSYTVVGEGEEREALEKLAEGLGIAERVHFAGYREDVLPCYAEADLFLVPSLWEGFGLVAAEAMATGLPVLAADVPGLDAVVGRDQAAGRLLDPRDPGAWERAVREFAGAESLLDVAGTAARERAAGFSIRETAQKYQDLYRALCE